METSHVFMGYHIRKWTSVVIPFLLLKYEQQLENLAMKT